MQQYRPITKRNIAESAYWSRIPKDLREDILVASEVFPFRTNTYVLENLIEWDNVPDDPIFRLNFPMREMLESEDHARIRAVRSKGDPGSLKAEVDRLHEQLNPHPSGQLTDNRPRLNGEPLEGLQHKYRETVLFFPTGGQTCHAYCTFCFRWAQFVGKDEYRMQMRETDRLVGYLEQNPQVTDVLITGGDPLIMKTALLRRYIEPLLDLEQIVSIRLGTKAISYWPQRLTGDRDSDDLIRLMEEIVARGKNLALMTHQNHPVELKTPEAEAAIRRVRATGATLRLQSPVIRHINDSADAWADMWSTAVNLGIMPYYMFVERDTGARRYFELPLAEALEIYQDAFRRVSGLARTARGPVMSCQPGKVLIDGVADIAGRRLFALQFLQAREPKLAQRPFFARFDPEATWFTDLQPGFDNQSGFFEHIPENECAA